MTRPDDEFAPDQGQEPDAPAERDPEAPVADAFEQAVSVKPVDQPAPVSRSFEVGEWDAVEQSIVVDIEDDYDR